MDLALIERLMKLLENSGLDTLDVTEGEVRIRLSKSAPIAMESARGNQASTADRLPDEVAQTGVHPSRVIIEAGLSGTFYRAPTPGGEPFIKMGDTVSDGDRLALIEAMKMLNPVESEVDGVVCAILVDDATPVEPGTALFEIEKTGP